jgi:hypothetical protein
MRFCRATVQVPWLHAAKSSRVPPDRLGRHAVPLGTTMEGHTFALPIRGRNMLITGDPRSGKSWATGLYCEQLILQGYCVWVVDPEGDYGTLECLPAVVGMAGEASLPSLGHLARALQYPDISVVVDLSRVPLQEKLAHLNSLLPMLAAHRQSTGLPHRIVVDEAHYFLHEPNCRQLLDLDLGAYTLVTSRPSDLNRDLLKAIEFTAATRVTDSRSLHALMAMSNGKGDDAQLKSMLRDLTVNEVVILPGITAGKNPQLIRLLPRLTPQSATGSSISMFASWKGKDSCLPAAARALGLPLAA